MQSREWKQEHRDEAPREPRELGVEVMEHLGLICIVGAESTSLM